MLLVEDSGDYVQHDYAMTGGGLGHGGGTVHPFDGAEGGTGKGCGNANFTLSDDFGMGAAPGGDHGGAHASY